MNNSLSAVILPPRGANLIPFPLLSDTIRLFFFKMDVLNKALGVTTMVLLLDIVVLRTFLALIQIDIDVRD
tara:strand:- start:16627 stop:16839 length:213 start_codon:yes stop_codon:yes gene_type:complete